MKELRLALDRHKKAPHSVSIIPGFLGLSFDQIKDKDLYSSMQWGKGGLPSKPDDTTLSEWQGLLKQLREFTGVRRDQVGLCVYLMPAQYVMTSSCTHIRTD